MVISMGGRQHDSAPAALPGAAGVARRGRLVVGLVLVAGATAAALLTDDPLHLRLALLAVCWAFVVAAFLAGDRRADQVAAAGREAELRHAYDLEVEREVSARHAYQAELEARLRRESEQALRAELVQLRVQLAGLSTLPGELAALPEIRSELAGLAELRSELGRMRTELTEQLSGELLVERMVMRAQSVRGPGQPAADRGDGRTLGSAPSREALSWEPPSHDPLSAVSPSGPGAGGWDADRWAETRVVPAEPVRPAPRPPAGTPPVHPPVRTSGWADERATAVDRPTAALGGSVEDSVPAHPAAGRATTAGSYDAAAYDELLFGTASVSSSRTDHRDGSPSYGSAAGPSEPDEPAPGRGTEPPGHARLEQILAGSGVPAPTGARSRRRRYRDEDGGTAGDDVLARVLGRS